MNEKHLSQRLIYLRQMMQGVSELVDLGVWPVEGLADGLSWPELQDLAKRIEHETRDELKALQQQ